MSLAAFLDRDGVINEADGFVSRPEDVRIINGAVDGIRLLNSLGMKVIVVTNQPQVARGMCTEEDVEKINGRISDDVSRAGGKIDAFYYCPHHPETHHEDIPENAKRYRKECECRKPKTGMLLQAAKDFGIDLTNSFVIGDRTVDVKSGHNAGCRTVLVKTGLAGNDKKYEAEADFVSNDLLAAAKLIKDLVSMKTLILAGGRGERLRPLTDDLPKPMIPIHGKPLIEHLIELSKKHGIENIVISGHYLFGKLMDYFGDGSRFGVKIEYVDDGAVPLGSGGAVKKCEKLLPENFVVFSGDVFTDINVWELVKFHFKKGGIATLVTRETDHPHDSDIIEIDKDHKAVNFYSKKSQHKTGNMANTGLFVLNKRLIGSIPDKSNLENDVIAVALKSYNIYCFLSKNCYIRDIGTPERLKTVQEDVEKLGLL
ncbi:MAG: HAD-IIIA family hydrolase [Candidatus Aenigmarchaeota archaeon]|nr:HAD-IIIA family hydrolase [Candidatus Aenigmarchaeota archaeon]